MKIGNFNPIKKGLLIWFLFGPFYIHKHSFTWIYDPFLGFIYLIEIIIAMRVPLSNKVPLYLPPYSGSFNQFKSDHSSFKLFWIGVPEMIHFLLVSNLEAALNVFDLLFLIIWPRNMEFW